MLFTARNLLILDGRGLHVPLLYSRHKLGNHTGLKLDGFDLCPDLKIGVTMATDQSVKKVREMHVRVIDNFGQKMMIT